MAKKKTKKKVAKKDASKSKVTKKKVSKKKSSKKKPTKKKAAKKKKKVNKKKSVKKKGANKKAAKKRASKKSTKKKVTKKKASKSKATKKRSPKKKTIKKKGAKKAVKEKLRSLASILFYGEQPALESAGVSPKTMAVERLITPREQDLEFKGRKDDLAQEYSRAKKVQAKILNWKKQGRFGNVTGCSVTFRTKGGVVVSPLRFVVEVFVAKKVSPVYLEKFSSSKKAAKGKIQMLPDAVDGILINVVESNHKHSVKSSGLVKPKDKDILVPVSEQDDLADTQILGGLPIVQSGQDDWGTLGITFSNSADDDSGSSFFGLANAHFAREGDSIVQPDVVPNDPTHWKIGTVAKDVEDHDSDGFYIDAAVIELNQSGTNSREIVSRVIQEFGTDKILFANRPLDLLDLPIKLFKFGASTARRLEGKLVDPDFQDLELPELPQPVNQVIWARGIGDSPFIEEGDSGSVLVGDVIDQQDGTPKFVVVGLCFAGSEENSKWAFAVHFSRVIEALSLEIPDDLLLDDWSYE